ncbi:hypothetical protein CSA56_01415 [candidate division KSB3 bacterium]|uniref:Uncharacterized protein n=1 Tax=candidate division KSB3 bacterium TaxID=2044937 RepID=A0A2G6KMN4_9BACT|nr:MAG: hypothetical protein CSA56_01415 [candidate division KSB3 bacterium]
MKNYRAQYAALFLCAGFFLIVGLTLDYRRAATYMFSDEFAYYMMAQSLAFDQDLEYTQEDLQRIFYKGWGSGPLGVFLSKTPDGRIYYSKSFVYSWIISPFVRLLDFNGALVLNVLFLFVSLWLGWIYLRQYTAATAALLIAGGFFLWSAGAVYLFWATPEMFNVCCITSGLFLWLYRGEPRSTAGSRRTKNCAVRYVTRFFRWLFLTREGRIYLAPIPLAFASVSKLPNVLFFAPLLADLLFLGLGNTDRRQQTAWHVVLLRLRKVLVVCVLFASIFGLFYGLQYRYTGQLNPYSGDRRTFYHRYPFDSDEDVWEQGVPLSTENYWNASFFFHPKTLIFNIYYYVFGRFTGMVPYFCCSFMALYYFLRVLLRRRKASCSARQAHWQRVFLLCAIVGSIGAYIVLMPINYQGGGGAFGNRYFVNIYPAFLFLITAISSLRPLLISWGIGTLFLGQALVTPFKSSFAPATHAFQFPFTLLPVELTLIDTLPNLINSHLMQTAMEGNEPLHRLYFFDEHVFDLSADEFWVRGEQKAELALRTFQKRHHLMVTVTNEAAANQVDVSVGDSERRLIFEKPYEQKQAAFRLEECLPYFTSSLYPLSIRSHSGFIPRFVPHLHSTSPRYAGCRVHLSFDEFEIGKAYVENAQCQDAIEVLEAVVRDRPDMAAAQYYLGLAYAQSGKMEQAQYELEQGQRLLPAFAERHITEISEQDIAVLPHYQTFSEKRPDDGLLPFKFRYEAEDLPRVTGSVTVEKSASGGKSVEFLPEKHRPGFISYGPYLELPAGAYWIDYRLSVAAPSTEPPGDIQHLVCFVEVYNPDLGILAQTTVPLRKGSTGDDSEYQTIRLPIDLEQPLPVEFRVRASGVAPLRLDLIDIIPTLPFRLMMTAGRLKAQSGDWEAAYLDLSKVADLTPFFPGIQNIFLETLLYLEKWDEAAAFITRIRAESPHHDRSALALLEETFPAPSEVPSTDLQTVLDEMKAFYTPQYECMDNFQESLSFLGFDLASEAVTAGEEVTIQYYWQALEVMEEDYTIFVHFVKDDVSAGEQVLSKIRQKISGIPPSNAFQQDHEPLHGSYPTSMWGGRERIREKYTFYVPPDIEPGTYAIWLGVYETKSGKRLTCNGKEKMQIGTLDVRSQL